MTVKFVTTIIAVGLLLGATGCSSKKVGSSHHTRSATPITNHTPNPTTTPNKVLTATTAFSVAVNDSKALNMTRVVRPTGEIAQKIQKAFENTNKLRAEKGVKPLRLDEGLTAFAQMRASEIANRFDHARLSGDSIFEPFTDWWLLGENIAAGSATADDAVLVQWKNSKGHYENIVNPTFETVGVGLVYVPNSQYGHYWVQFFSTDAVKSPYQFIDGNIGNTQPLSQVVVAGKTIPITVPNKGQWQAINNGNTGWVTGYDNSRFGVVTPTGSTAQLFYQGNQTADTAMPKSGTATYNGTGLMVKNGTTHTNLQSQMTANFATRKLDGTLKQNGSTLYNINADINGSNFASKAGASVETQGAFFGNNAEELNGVFKDTKTDTKGVFGGKK